MAETADYIGIKGKVQIKAQTKCRPKRRQSADKVQTKAQTKRRQSADKARTKRRQNADQSADKMQMNAWDICSAEKAGKTYEA